MKINNIVNLIKNVYKSTILCIKYPFLYTRNRYNGKHYNNPNIQNKIYQLNTDYNVHLPITIYTQDEFDKHLEKIEVNDPSLITDYKKVNICNSFLYNERELNIIRIDKNTVIIEVKKNKNIVNTVKIDIDEYLNKIDIKSSDIALVLFEIHKTVTWLKKEIIRPYIVFVLRDDIQENKKHLFTSVFVELKKFNKFKIKYYLLLNNILGIFHILPSHTELDTMEYGWRKSFGEDICKEIRNSILTTYIKNENPSTIFDKIKCYYKGIRHLYHYRIEQIKEKYGSLRWYAYGDTEDTLKIISKYENISENTCIVCGNPATYRSTGWICPYCDEHKPDGSIKISSKETDIEE